MDKRTRIAGMAVLAAVLTASLSVGVPAVANPTRGRASATGRVAGLPGATGVRSPSGTERTSGRASAATLAPGPYLKRPDVPRAVWATAPVEVAGLIIGRHEPGPRVARLELWHAEGRVWVLRRYGYVAGSSVKGGLRFQVTLKPLVEGRWRAIVIHPSDGSAARSTSAWTYLRSVRSRVVALTFDDGPTPGNTDDVLAVLGRLQVKATFFLGGKLVRSHPAAARRVVALGHAIGNHSQTHMMLGRQSASRVYWEIAAATAQIRRTTGVTPLWFRPPGGSTSATVRAQCRKLGIRHILWDVDPQDWRGRGAARTVRDVLSHARPGAVVLMHDGPARRIGTASAVANIVPALRSRGYDFVTLDELGALKGYWR